MTLMGVSYEFDPPTGRIYGPDQISGRIEPVPPGPFVDPRQPGTEPLPPGSSYVREIPRPGIRPPDNEMPWQDWRQLEAELDAPPGWSACRFPTWRPGEHAVSIESGAVDTRPENAGICAFVFGIVRGDFGIWRQPFPVCITDDDGMFVDQREDVLVAVTHLPSGLGMGIFTDRDSALASCTAADGLGIDWRRIHPNEQRTWVDSFSRLKQAREFAGIAIVHNRHAHVGSPDGPRCSIWEQRADAMAEGRPEKLS